MNCGAIVLYLDRFFWLTHKQTNKTPLRLYQDRQPIDPVDIVETAAIASQIHCLANRRDVLLFVSVYGVPPASSIVSSKPPAFCFIFVFFPFLSKQTIFRNGFRNTKENFILFFRFNSKSLFNFLFNFSAFYSDFRMVESFEIGRILV